MHMFVADLVYYQIIMEEKGPVSLLSVEKTRDDNPFRKVSSEPNY